MSMLSQQADELREKAKLLRAHADGLAAPFVIPSTKELMALTMLDSASRMEEAADTIESLRDRLQESQSEATHWRLEQVHAYGNWEDAYKRVIELEANNGTRWHELFGTPERAARTLSTIANCMGTVVACCDCAYKGLCDKECDYDALLEWLEGEVE